MSLDSRDALAGVRTTVLADSRWELLRLGLALLRPGLVAIVGLVVAGTLVLGKCFAVDSGMIALLVASAACAICMFVGHCLCCAVPAAASLRLWSRGSVLLFFLSGFAAVLAIACLHDNLANFLPAKLRIEASLLASMSFCCLSLAVLGWLMFLKDLARFLCEDWLADQLSAFLAFGGTALLALCMSIPFVLPRKDDDRSSLIVMLWLQGFVHFMAIVYSTRLSHVIAERMPDKQRAANP